MRNKVDRVQHTPLLGIKAREVGSHGVIVRGCLLRGGDPHGPIGTGDRRLLGVAVRVCEPNPDAGPFLGAGDESGSWG